MVASKAPHLTRTFSLSLLISNREETQNRWVSGLLHHPEFQVLENTTCRKLDLVPSSSEDEETPTLLDPLDRANRNHFIHYIL
jgi:hypothetical protein